MEWRFKNIPPDEQDQVLEAFAKEDYKTIFEIYTKRKVPAGRIAPCCATRLLIEWTQWAISTGKIKSSASSTG